MTPPPAAPTPVSADEAPTAGGPRLDAPIAAGGYRWHYVDGVSADGRSGVVIIAMLGNPFSPAYARARDRGAASPLPYCAMNVALYHPRRPGPGRHLSSFALDERRVAPSALAPRALRIGGSEMRWDGDRLVIDVDERTTPGSHPIRRPIRGRVTIHPEAPAGLALTIDHAGLHRWWPIAPLARVEVDLPEPGVRWVGHGYHDANAGDVPLEATFDTWSWSRGRAGDAAYLTYDVLPLDGAPRTHALRIGAAGDVAPLEGTETRALEGTLWRVPRRARVDAGAPARTVRTLEDGPFYARSLVETRLGGAHLVAMHETLAAQRLRRGWVRFCTGYRMRRGGGAVQPAEGGSARNAS